MSVVVKTRTYTTGDTLSASNYNADRDEIIAGVNSIVNAQIAAGAAIEYAKLNLTGGIVNADISGSAAIAYSKLNLASSIVEADLNLSDNTTGDVSTSKHGFVPKLPNNTTTFLRADGIFAAPVSSSVAGAQRVSVYRTGAQTIANSTDTPVQFDNERFDTDSMHDNVTNNSRITFNTSGVYCVLASVVWNANTSGRRFSYIRLNGSAIISQSDGGPNNSGYAEAKHCFLYNFTAGDYIQFEVTQTSGGNLDIAGSQPNNFDAFRVA